MTNQDQASEMNGANNGQNEANAKPKTSKKTPFLFETDTSRAAQALMEAFRLTNERLHPEKVKRA